MAANRSPSILYNFSSEAVGDGNADDGNDGSSSASKRPQARRRFAAETKKVLFPKFHTSSIRDTPNSPPSGDVVVGTPLADGESANETPHVSPVLMSPIGINNIAYLVQQQHLQKRRGKTNQRTDKKNASLSLTSHPSSFADTAAAHDSEQLSSSSAAVDQCEDGTDAVKLDSNQHRRNENKAIRKKKAVKRIKEAESNPPPPHNKARNTKPVRRKVTDSEWILVSNIPAMSKLSDLFPSLAKIVEFEMRKGIIDLDALEELKEGSANASMDDSREGGGTNDFDEETTQALRQLKALGSLYSTQHIGEDSGIPLWTPPQEDTLTNKSMPSHMVLEARIHLSYRARPLGWFLRFPDRSIAHAVLNHIRHADLQACIQGRQNEPVERRLKEERKDWREGLWRGVWNEYEREADEVESRLLLESEGEEERELMWGDVADTKMNTNRDDGEVEESEQSDTTSAEAEPPRQDVGSYLDEYLQSNPYPGVSESLPIGSELGYQKVMCGSTTLDVQEFHPLPLDYAPSNKQQPSWEQHSFHIGQLLDLSDSVVRVETFALKTSVENIQYLFRGHDLESIWPAESTVDASHPYSELPKSIGWNLHASGPQRAVDFLMRGENKLVYHDNDDTSDDEGSVEGRGEGGGRNRNSDKINKPTKNTFIVRFASPSVARMAVRDMQGTHYLDKRLLVSQFPRQDVPSV